MRNSLERFQVTETRRGIETELGMRQNKRVRERREKNGKMDIPKTNTQ